jgi:hypothetical protein
MKEIKIFTKPMTENERSDNFDKPLKMPVRYHLVDCLKDLQFGRPANNQKQIQKWITELNKNLELGVPFT